MKDNFSTESDKYAKFRPAYPNEFFDYLNSIVQSNAVAWDCGTGTGQIASVLSKNFDSIQATDISQSQIDNAIKRSNITYSVQPAEKTSFDDNLFDLVIIAQAIHWFDFDRFYTEVNRTAKNNSIICIIGYGRLEVNEKIDSLITNFYTNVIGEYWDKERKFVDDNYQTIPFPFDEIHCPKFSNQYSWNLAHLRGYLNTWSAVKHFIKQNKTNPVDDLINELGDNWKKDEFKNVNFPILLRIGKIKDN